VGVPDGPAAVGEREPASAGLRANRDFQIVLGGQAVSALGDAITLTAMPLLVLALTGSGALMGVVGALQLVPDLVLGLPAGALADRMDRRRLMMWSDAGRAALTALIPLSSWFGSSTITVIVVLAIPVNVLRVLSDAAFTSAIPGLVGRDQLGKANGYMEATLSVPFVIGPAVAGVLIATIGAASTIAIDAATFAVSAASLTLVRRTLRAERPAAMPNVLADITEGIRFVWRRLVLRLSIAFWTAIMVGTAALIPALGYYVTIDRNLGAEIFGFAGSTWSVGYLAGSLIAARLGPERVGRRMIVAGVAIGVSLITIASADAPPVYVVVPVVIGFSLAIVTVSYVTLRASNTPDELLGRVGSSARALSLGLTPLGLLAGGAVIEAADGATALMAMGGACIATGALFALSRTFRDARYG
jgi:MFS family permease